MAEHPTSIHHISDTARWVAVYRAQETERKDALFHDPFARQLAGERGEEIARVLARNRQPSWPLVARTWLLDRIVNEQVKAGIDMVVNLAAGLDTRPYRMALPSSLLWIEVDLPDILDYKEEILGAAKPVCRLERIRQDLADTGTRRALLDQIGKRSGKALVITEGLLVYLSTPQVEELAGDLASVAAFKSWAMDLPSPGLVRMLNRQIGRHITEGAANFQFGPANGPYFFTQHGWTPIEVHSQLKTASLLKRLPWIFRLFALFPDNPAKLGSRPWSGVCLLKNERQ